MVVFYDWICIIHRLAAVFVSFPLVLNFGNSVLKIGVIEMMRKKAIPRIDREVFRRTASGLRKLILEFRVFVEVLGYEV